MREPSDVVLGYIADYYRWNQAARGRMHQAGASPADQIAAAVRSGMPPADLFAALQAAQRPADLAAAAQAADREYAALLGPYFRPGTDLRPASIGDPPLHQPGREVVVSESRDGDRCVIGTRLTQLFGTAEMALHYEYHLSRVGDRWYVERIVSPADGAEPGDEE